LSPWWKNREHLAFLLLLLVHLVPIWAFDYFPSQDGPAHLENANILQHFHDPNRSLFREYYVLNRDPNPNWFGHLLLVALMYVFPPRTAEKLFLSGYVLLLPISIRYAIRAVNPDNAFLSIMAFPFIYNFLFHMGFYNFSYSLPVYFFVLGCWFQNSGELTVAAALKIGFLSILLYFCHLVSLVMAIAAVSVSLLWSIVYDSIELRRKPPGDRGRNVRLFRQRLLPLFLALLPTLVLVLFYLENQGVSTSDKWGLLDLFRHIVTLSSLWSYDRVELIGSTSLVLLFAVLTVPLLISKARHGGIVQTDSLLFVFLIYVIVYFLAPDAMSGGQYITPRLILFPFFSLLLWFSTGSYRRKTRTRVVATASVISLFLLALHIAKYAELNDYLDEYMSASHAIEENTTLLPLSFSHKGHGAAGRLLSDRVRPFLFAFGYIAAEKPVIDLHNYEARTQYFPFRYRSNLDPFRHIWINKSLYVTPHVNFLDYPERTGGRVDYVLLWGYKEGMRAEEFVESTFRQLEAAYRMVYTSKRGLIRLYRLNRPRTSYGRSDPLARE
jgi:hypothetical protein